MEVLSKMGKKCYAYRAIMFLGLLIRPNNWVVIEVIKVVGADKAFWFYRNPRKN